MIRFKKLFQKKIHFEVGDKVTCLCTFEKATVISIDKKFKRIIIKYETKRYYMNGDKIAYADKNLLRKGWQEASVVRLIEYPDWCD